MVLAGTGDSNMLAKLRARHHNHELPFGNQMATHMALGLLFLGGGRFTLASSERAIAMMVIAFFPRFPSVSSDNRAHLQAFRHLWLLAVEPRLVIARDVDTQRSENIQVERREETGAPTRLHTPCLLPNTKSTVEVRSLSERHWPRQELISPSTASRFFLQVKRKPASVYQRDEDKVVHEGIDADFHDGALAICFSGDFAEQHKASEAYSALAGPSSMRAFKYFFAKAMEREEESTPADLRSALMQASTRAATLGPRWDMTAFMQAAQLSKTAHSRPAHLSVPTLSNGEKSLLAQVERSGTDQTLGESSSHQDLAKRLAHDGEMGQESQEAIELVSSLLQKMKREEGSR